jgi:acyl-CoA thioesterase-2
MTTVDHPTPTSAQVTATPEAWQDLRSLLRVERIGPDVFRAPITQTGHQTVFGGLVAALAVLAVGHSAAPGQLLHSLHAYFLRRGNDAPHADIHVRRIRDGRSFAVREVEVVQGEKTIFLMTASLHTPEEGDDWYEEPAEPRPPGPDAVVLDQPTQRLRDVGMPFDIQNVAAPRANGFVPLHPMWLRHRLPTPADPWWQAAALAYISDLGVVMDARPPASSLPFEFIGTSLDHAVWFHRPGRVDEWLLMECDPLSSAGGRALAHARIRDSSGRLVATILQEGLHRRAL